MKKVLGVILGGLLLLPVVSNAADAQKAADNKKPVNSWIFLSTAMVQRATVKSLLHQ